MALLFKRKHEIQRQEDPGAKLMNRVIMLGLLVFLGISVLNEKRALDTTKLVWDAALTNNVTNKAVNIRVIENDALSFQLSDAEIEKLKDMPRTNDGKVEVFSLKLNRIVVKEPAQKTAVKGAEKNLTPTSVVSKEQDLKQNLPADVTPQAPKAAPLPAKTNVTP